MKNQWIGVFIATLLLCLLLPISSSLAYTCGDFTYIIQNDGTAMITDYNIEKSQGRLVIPSSLDGWKVTAIGDKAFYNSYWGGELVLPNSVTFLGNYAFKDCHIDHIDIPYGVAYIGKECFDSVAAKEISLPNSIELIGEAAFADNIFSACVIPQSVSSVSNRLFSNCDALKSVTLHQGIISIGYSAFAGCSALEHISIPNSVQSIGHHAFFGCKKLISVSLPNQLTAIEKTLFESCVSLRDVWIPASVDTIGASAFLDCTDLTSVSIPEGVERIDGYAFGRCNALSEVILPQSVTYIDTSAFQNVFSPIKGLTLVLPQGSYAETYALETGIPYSYSHWMNGGNQAVYDDGITATNSPVQGISATAGYFTYFLPAGFQPDSGNDPRMKQYTSDNEVFSVESKLLDARFDDRALFYISSHDEMRRYILDLIVANPQVMISELFYDQALYASLPHPEIYACFLKNQYFSEVQSRTNLQTYTMCAIYKNQQLFISLGTESPYDDAVQKLCAFLSGMIVADDV